MKRWVSIVSVLFALQAASAIDAPPPPTKVDARHVTVFQEPGRYGGWPANQGIWHWDDEIVVGFTAAWYKPAVSDHAVDRSKPFEKWQARSLDGGQTWKIEMPEALAKAPPMDKTPTLTKPIDFTRPNFAMMFEMGNQNVGPSRFYVSSDRCRTWEGPYALAVEGIDKVAARTDLLVLGPRQCLMFGSAAKSNDKEGRCFCARTDDGGLTWKLVSLIGDEPEGYSIMPASVRLQDGTILTTVRHFDPVKLGSIDAYQSDDLGRHWTTLDPAAPNIGGGNPPSIVPLKDGRLALAYGYRAKPFGVRARISSDGGKSWSGELVLRDDGLTGDLGYCRSVQRPDGNIVTIYYFNGPERDEDRTIQATIWSPPPLQAPGVAGSEAPVATAAITPTAPAAASPAAASPPRNSPVIVDHVRFYPAPKLQAKMVGGKFTGSNVSPSEGFHLLAEITAEPKPDEWTDLTFENHEPYRWVRYEAPPGSRGNVAEVEFYSGSRKLSGGGFGSPGSQPPGGHWKTALDGKLDTFFNSGNADGQFVGLDLGDQASTARPQFSPVRDGLVTINSPTPGATIRYTLDGCAPDRDSAIPYTAPIKLVGPTTTLVAAAFKDGLAPSPTSYATFQTGAAPVVINSFHVGNSLTGNAARFPIFAKTAGIDSQFHSFLMGGAYTVKLWKAKDEAEKPRWEQIYASVHHPLDHFTMQPRDFDVDEEVAYELKFLNLVREKSPDVQPWLYAEWVEMDRNRPSDKGLSPSYQMTKLFPALTWEESMSAMLLYVEEVQHRLNALDKSGKRARVLPCSLALGWARDLVDNNQLPGIPGGQASFYNAFFEDHVHVNPSGCYLVDLIWYAAFMKQSPEGRLLPVGTTLTPEQAKLLQRLAWDIVKNYPDCGLYEEGTSSVGAPLFSVPAGPIGEPTPIHLTTSTPGAFFRYTLDGTTPTRTRGYVYCGVLTARPGMTVKAIAFESGMADSPVSDVTYLQK